MTDRPWHAHELEDIEGVGVRWDDLRFPAAFGKAIAGKEPNVDSDGLLLFDDARIETIAIVVQMPHAWKAGSTIHPHVHWMKSTSAAGNVQWRMEYKIAKIGEVMDAAHTVLTVEDTIPATPDTNTADMQMLTELGMIDMTGIDISDSLVILISRMGGEVLDTYTGDAKLLEFDLHYQIDSRGSRQEYVK